MAATSHEVDQFGQVEARGIDRVPADERHGKPSDLFWVWAASNVNYLYIVLGGLLMVFGLDVWQGLLVVVVGNLFWGAIGLLAVSGPVSGTPSSVITRSMFGIRGNRVFTGVFNWPTFIAFEAINLCLGALAGFAFADQLGVSPNRPVQILVVVVTAAVTLAISIYGHATILRMSGVFTGVLALAMLVLGGFVLAKADWGYSADPSFAPSGGVLVATMIAGVTIMASSPLSWGISGAPRRPPRQHLHASLCLLDRGRRLHPGGRARLDRRPGRQRRRHGGPTDEPGRDPARLVLPGVPADDRVRLHHQQHPHDVQLGPLPAVDRHRAATFGDRAVRRRARGGAGLLRALRLGLHLDAEQRPGAVGGSARSEYRDLRGRHRSPPAQQLRRCGAAPTRLLPVPSGSVGA